MSNSYEVSLENFIDDINGKFEERYGDSKVPSLKSRKVIVNTRGKVYDKVIVTEEGKEQSVYCFIVKADTNKFPRGSILKAAGWSKPALNFTRGNIFEGDFSRCDVYGVS